MNLNIISPELHNLRKLFNDHGYDLRLVGGVVRDLLANLPNKDIDLCTDADPDTQVKIYKESSVRFIETGKLHGTITVVLNNVPYEITSLRVDVETDGRHAKVEFTNDWVIDLNRRDLTINAMALTFDGEIIDPFNGQEDLKNGVVRFVGNADDRINEDFLRILRWFRFFGRFGKNTNNAESIAAIARNAKGLENISAERIWSEVKRILPQRNATHILNTMYDAGVLHEIIKDIDTFSKTHDAGITNPEILIAALFSFDVSKVEIAAEELKWSNIERDHALWFSQHVNKSVNFKRLLAVNNIDVEWVVELAIIKKNDIATLRDWKIPVFPVNGNDLIELGFKPGKNFKVIIDCLKDVWVASDFTASKDMLLAEINNT